MGTGVFVGHVYRHYKGTLYGVLGLVRHTETQEMLVVYRRAELDKGNGYARPLDNFRGDVLTEEGLVPRFSLIGTWDFWKNNRSRGEA